jgi:hypothetical protein
MAERIVRQLIDDLDGSEILEGKGEQIEFALRGVTYRIDLATDNVAKLEKALAPFIESATKVGGRQGRFNGTGRARSPLGAPRYSKASKASKASKDDVSAIRAWAAKQGHKVSARGRIPGDVMQAYKAAHRGK